MARNTLLESRYFIHGLRPLLAGETDLGSMAGNHVKEFRTVAGIPVELNVDGDAGRVSVEVATAFYRILQEALANVLKHAEASEVRVLVRFEGTSVQLAVRDDGVGFDKSAVGSGFGLGNMTQRAESLGGTFEIAGAPGQGTTVSVTLPEREVKVGPDQGDDRG
jgi:two-component system NarL family sensor kinase